MNISPLEFKIRPLSKQDTNKVFILKQESIEHLCSENYNSQQINAIKSNKSGDIDPEKIDIYDSVGLFLANQVDSYIEESNPGAIVADIDNEIIGYASRGISSWFNQSKIYEMFVHPQYARRGVGTKLLETLEENARNNNCQVITVAASLTGEPFYLASGYRVVARTDSCASGVRIPIVRMEKWLSTPTETDKFFYEVSEQVNMGVEWLATETFVFLKEFFK